MTTQTIEYSGSQTSLRVEGHTFCQRAVVAMNQLVYAPMVRQAFTASQPVFGEVVNVM